MGFAALYTSCHSYNFCSTGKSLFSVNPKFPLAITGQLSGISPPVSPDKRGARDRHETRVEMRWTQVLRVTSAADADGEGVWF
jgi:hypothetical protein